jgi:DNA-binding transcriptional LysR family regulator
MDRDPYDVMDLKALKCFWATAKHLSLTKAGLGLGISEAAVSQRVKSREKRLGTKLYEARGGRVRLTSAGETTYGVILRRRKSLHKPLNTLLRLLGVEQ